jgi:inner membrane protein
MDSVTHAACGAALMLALPRRPATAWAVPSAMLVSSAPDVDVLFPAAAPVDFLLLHRGITHSLAALPVEAVLCALLLMYPLWRRGAEGRWSFTRSALFAAALLLLHIWLDCATTYGTMIFQPFSEYRVRLNGLFIVDLLLLVPLIAACLFARKRPRLAAAVVAWTLLYSVGAVARRAHLERQWESALRAEGVAVEMLSVLPDAFSPFFWKAQYADGVQAVQIPLDWKGEQKGPSRRDRRADSALLARLAEKDRSARIWASFALLPLQEKLPWDDGGAEYRFFDRRFASLVPFVRKIQELRGDEGTTPFRLSARLNARGELVAVRYEGSTGRRDWLPPTPPAGRGGWRRLVGLGY